MADDNEQRPKTVVCGFCGCKNTIGGEVLKLSEEAKEYRDAPEVSKKLQTKLDAAEATIAELREQIKKLKDAPAAAGDDDDDDY